MKLATILIISLCGLASQASSRSYIMSHYVGGCNSWSYTSSPTGSGYLCSSPQLQVQVPDSFQVQQAISDLEMKVQDLQRRVQELEQKNP